MIYKNQGANRVAIITGASRRIGAEISRTFHHHGYDIAIHYNNSENDAETLAKELNQIRHNSAKTFKAQLGSITDIKSMVTRILKWRKKLNKSENFGISID